MVNPLIQDTDGSFITTDTGIAIAAANPLQDADIETFDFSLNLLKAILWQYNEAEHLQNLLSEKQAWYTENQTSFWYNWYYDVFNLPTANDFGCAVWSIILQLPLFVNTPPSPIDKPTFGFDASYFKNFNRGNFSTRGGGSQSLSLATKRLILQLRYFQLVTSGTVPEINRFLKYIFGDMGGAFLLDNGNMTQTYIFRFPLSAELLYAFKNFDILPRPASVGSTYRTTAAKFFGFGPSWNRVNFNRGNFQS